MKKRFIMPFIFTYIAVFLSVSAPAGVASSHSEEASISFYRTELAQVLHVLAERTGIEMITSSALADKKITASLRNVTGEEAIDAILKANGLYRERMADRKTYIVRETPAVEAPRFTSETVFLQYARAGNLGAIIAPLLGEGGHVIVDERTNSITMREKPEFLAELKNIINSLDKAVSQVSIEAVLVEVATDRLRDLGIRWNVAASAFGPALDTSFPWQESYSRDVVGPRRGTQTSEVQPPQFTLGTISLQDLTASLRILESKGEANILANPRITTLNDSPAEIKITKEMAIAPERRIEALETGRGVGDFIYEYRYEDVGITLSVTPNINAEGYITLDVEPTVSSPSPSAVFPDAVDINKRTAKTKVMVKDGETLVIGGLLSQDKITRTSKVPLLGDILPFLFSRTDTQDVKTDLVMFLTPRIITSEQASVIASEEKERMGQE